MKKENEAIFLLAQDTLSNIKECKKDQRSLTMGFIGIVVSIIVLTEVLIDKFNVEVSIGAIKFIIFFLGSLIIYLLIRSQKTLSNFRRRQTKIWNDVVFKEAFGKGILEYRNDNKEEYSSFWNGFWGFLFVYCVLIA